MDAKIPFYLAYPDLLQQNTPNRQQEDLEYLQQMYPDMAKKILKVVNRQLDFIDYKGSILYHEYPDRIGIYRIVWAILFEMEKEANESGEFYSAEKRMWMEDMIKIVLFQEMFKRRSTGRNMWY